MRYSCAGVVWIIPPQNRSAPDCLEHGFGSWLRVRWAGDGTGVWARWRQGVEADGEGVAVTIGFH